MKLENVNRAVDLKDKIQRLEDTLEKLQSPARKVQTIFFDCGGPNVNVTVSETAAVEVLRVTMIKFLHDRKQILLAELGRL